MLKDTIIILTSSEHPLNVIKITLEPFLYTTQIALYFLYSLKLIINSAYCRDDLNFHEMIDDELNVRYG